MSKFSDFPRLPLDIYDTPAEAFRSLAPYLPQRFRYVEPCAGAGCLIDGLKDVRPNGICLWASDIKPRSRRHRIKRRDALELTAADIPRGAKIITNLPHKRIWLHPLIEHLSDLAPLWTLCDGNWIFTQQAAPFNAPGRYRLHQIVAAQPRLKLFPNTPGRAKFDMVWLKFGRPRAQPPVFHGWQPPK